jgi:hypothetical protein
MRGGRPQILGHRAPVLLSRRQTLANFIQRQPIVIKSIRIAL